MSLNHSLPWECDNWSTCLTKHEKLAGVVRISAGAFLAPGQEICPSSVPQMSLNHSLPWECDNWSTWLSKYEKLVGVVRISAGAFLAPGQEICPSSVPRVPQMSLNHSLPWESECDNWSTWLSKYEKLVGMVRISAGAFLAPGQEICPSSVPRVPEMSLNHSLSWECDNWSTWLSKYEKLAGVVRISAGAFLAPGQEIFPQVSLVSLKCPSTTLCPGNVIIGLHV